MRMCELPEEIHEAAAILTLTVNGRNRYNFIEIKESQYA